MTEANSPEGSEGGLGRRDQFFLKELELIQGVIERMASNSFYIKGWAVTLVAAVFVLEGGTNRVWIAFLPIMIFWILDAYYVRQERLYRHLYSWVIDNRRSTSDHLFDLETTRFEDKVGSHGKMMFSLTLLWFYAAIGVATAVYAILTYS